MTTQNPAQPSDLFFEPLVNGYLANPRFVRRDWLAKEIDHRLSTESSRFVLLTAEPGFGKSAFMAQLAADHPDWPRYFIRRDQRAPLSDVGARSFLLRIGFQLAALHPELFTTDAIRLTVEQRVGAVKEGGSVVGAEIGKILASPFYKIVIRIQQQIEQVEGSMVGLHIDEIVIEPRLLELADLQYMALIDPARAMQRLHPERQIVIALDALDEVRYHQSDDNVLAWLANCPDLPSNVRFILTSRPPEGAVRLFMDKQQRVMQVLAIAAQDREEAMRLNGQVDKDLAAYVDKLASDAAIKTHLDALPDGAAGFKQQAMVKADGNIGYLDALARAIDQALHSQDNQTLAALLAAKYLPDDMQGLYAFFIHQIKGIVGETNVLIELPDTGVKVPVPMWSAIYEPLLAVLAVAREPVTLEQIRYLGGITAGWADLNAAKDRLLQFLDIVDRRYRLYHATLPEFLIDTHTKENTATEDLYVDAGEWHKRIGDRYWRSYSQDWSQCDTYGLAHLPAHLDAAAQERLRTLLFDFTWLQAKLVATNVTDLISDYDFTRDDTDLRLVRDALRLAAQIVAQDKTQLAGQLVGRLSALDTSGIRTLVEGATAWRGAPWLCPLTHSLNVPGGPLVRTLKGRLGGHTGTPRSLAITSDGRWAISAGNSTNDQTVRVWNLETGECRYVFQQQASAGGYTPVALATAGNLALTAYGDNLRAWDLTTGTLRDSVRIAGGNVTAMALTDDGRRAVAGLMNGSIHLWDIEQRTVVDLPGHPEAIQALGVTPDGRRAVSISASLVKAWDLEALCEVSALQGPTYQGESWFDAAALALAPDGHTVYYGNPLMQWEIDQSAAVEVSVESISGKILAVSADGGRAISKLDDKLLAVWDLPGQKRLLNLPLGSAAVAVIAMTPDGRKAITADFDHDLRFWDTSSAEILVAPNAQSEAEFVDFAGGKIAVFRLDNNRFRLWDLDGLAFLPDVGADNEWVQEALGSQRLKAQAHDLVDTQLRAVLVPPTIDETGAGELSYPKLLMQIRLRQLTVVMSADGKRAVSRTLGGKTRDYEEGMQRVETVAREVPISDLFDKPDSPETRSFLATSTVCLWDLDGKPKLRLLEGHGSPISCLAITPDGRRALSGSAGRGVRAWNLDAGTQLWTLRGHQGIVSSVAITVDGRRGVSASEDSTLSMWNLETGQPIATFTGEARMGMCQISPDGRVVIAQEPTGRLHLLRLCGAAE